MDIRHSSPEQQMGKALSVVEMDDAPRLTEDDRRVLEAVRRRLDREYPGSPRRGRAARRIKWDAAGNEETEQTRRPWNRASVTWIGAGTLLLTCAAGGAAGALAALL